MREIIKKIFDDHGFRGGIKNKYMDNKPAEGLDVYVNGFDEMYFIMSGTLQRDTLSRIINICAKEEENDFIKKSWKSNWVLIYITEISAELTKEQKKIVMQIEENKFFCRKYVFWYSGKEKEALKELCKNDFSIEALDEKISNAQLFGVFKKKGDKGYECLSRLYIKLPFLNLRQIPTTDETIFTCINDEIKLINEKLAEKFEDGEIEEILKLVELNEKELKELDQNVKAIGEGLA